MPLIDLHGILPPDQDQLYGRIRERFTDAPYFGRLMIEFTGSSVRSLETGKPDKYIRIVATTGTLNEYFDDISERLARFGIGIERMPIDAYIEPVVGTSPGTQGFDVETLAAFLTTMSKKYTGSDWANGYAAEAVRVHGIHEVDFLARLENAADAHHRYQEKLGHDDPDWARWYAEEMLSHERT